MRTPTRGAADAVSGTGESPPPQATSKPPAKTAIASGARRKSMKLGVCDMVRSILLSWHVPSSGQIPDTCVTLVLARWRGAFA